MLDRTFKLVRKLVAEGKYSEAEAFVNNQAGGFSICDWQGSLLNLAVIAGDVALVEWLLSKGVDVRVRNVDGLTALMFACQLGREDMVRTILVHDPSQVNDRCKGLDVITRGRTPIMFAASGGNPRVAEFLLSLGAEVNAQDTAGVTALQIAAECRGVEMMDTLLKHGADLFLLDDDGRDALFYTADNEGPEAAAFLLSKGADVNRTDRYGRMGPLALAVLGDNVTMVEFYLEHGANASMADPNGESVLDLAKRLPADARIIIALSEALQGSHPRNG